MCIVIAKFLPPLVAESTVQNNLTIPVSNYGYIGKLYIGPQVNPLQISTTAYDYYVKYLRTGDEKFKASAIGLANWLVNNAVARGNFSSLEYRFPWPQYNLTSPWSSAMAQALAIRSLISTYKLTGNQSYTDTAKKLLNSFFVEVKDGGVTYKTKSDGWWYESFAGKGGKQPKVLDGMMYALLEIYDYYKYTKDPKAKYLFDQGITALKKNLPSYDYSLYFYSYFDRLHTPSTLFFNNVNVKLLAKLFNITKIEIFAAYSDRWQDYKVPEFSRRPAIVVVDEDGIPYVDYKGLIGKQSNPVAVTHSAMDYYSNYRITGNTTHEKRFLNTAHWLVKHAVSHGEYSILEYRFPLPQYNLHPPWQSAMAQGRALQVLERAYKLTGNQSYTDTAKKLLNSFFVEVKDGGVTYKTKSDGWWYELFAGKGGKQPKVLNGMMYALLGIYDYYKYTKDPKAKYLFDQGITALKKNLPLYRHLGNYSNYDIHGSDSSLAYHKVHIKLLNLLYEITNDEMFRSYYNLWQHFTPPAFLHGQKCRITC